MTRRIRQREAVRTDLGPVRMWRDDLTLIVNLIREVAPNVKIRTDRYDLDEMEDLIGVEEPQIGAFMVTAGDRRFKLSLKRLECFIEAEDPDLKMRGAIAEIEKTARKCRRGFLALRTLRAKAIYYGLGGALTLFVAISVFTTSYSFPRTRDEVAKSALAVIGGMLMATVTVARRGAIMYTRTRAEAPTWWQRNSEGFWTNVIVSAIFLIVGIVIGMLLPDK